MFTFVSAALLPSAAATSIEPCTWRALREVAPQTVAVSSCSTWGREWQQSAVVVATEPGTSSGSNAVAGDDAGADGRDCAVTVVDRRGGSRHGGE